MGHVIDWLSTTVEAYPSLRLDLLLRLMLAILLGGAIGWEREHAHKPAGLRTNMLICVGAALLADLSVEITQRMGTGDPARIAAQIVPGVGFLGAGTILQARGSVTGLTTAATLWVVAAIGMAVGFGALIEATGTAVLVLVVLIPLRSLEGKAEARRRRVKISAVGDAGGTGGSDVDSGGSGSEA